MFAVVEDSGQDWIYANHLNQERTGNRSANGPPLVGIELSIPIQRNDDSDNDDDDNEFNDDDDDNESFQDDTNNNNNYDDNENTTNINRRDIKKRGDVDPNATTSKSTRKSRSVLRQVSSGQRRGGLAIRSDSKKRMNQQHDNIQSQSQHHSQQPQTPQQSQHQQQRSERRTRTSDPLSKSSNRSHSRSNNGGKSNSLGNNNSDHYQPHTKLTPTTSSETRSRRQSLHMNSSHNTPTSSNNNNNNNTMNSQTYHGPSSGGSNVRRTRSSNDKDHLLMSTTNHSNGSGTGPTSFFKLLDIDPTKQRYKLDEEKFMEYITEDPSLCTKKHTYMVCNGDSIYPLHMICALGASLNTVKYCYKLYPDALEQPSLPRLLSCLHYAVLFTRAPLDVIMFLAKKDPDAIHSVTRKKQTPLHLACLCPPTLKVYNPEVVQLLTEIGQQALCLQLDKHGRTPLHIACGLETPCLEVVEDLTEVNNTACLAQCYDYQSTPLHIACSNRFVGDETHVIVDVIKDLVRSCPECVRIMDKDGQLPIYVAVTNRACLKVCKMLVRKYPECLEFTFNHPISPNNKKINLHELAKILQLDPPVVDFLNPFED